MNTKIVYIRPSEMLLSNQERMTFCSMLSSQPDIKIKITIQIPKMHINPIFCVLSATATAFEK